MYPEESQKRNQFFQKPIHAESSTLFVDYINKIRMDRMKSQLNAQEEALRQQLRIVNIKETSEIKLEKINASKAKREFDDIRTLVNNPERIQGNPKTKHGIIAEHVEVGFNNADRHVRGELPTHRKEVDLKSPIDYYNEEKPIQSKFHANNNSINACCEHLEANPDFVKQGGAYDIPYGDYERAKKWLELSDEELHKIPYSENRRKIVRIVEMLRKLEKEQGKSFEEVFNPAQVDYNDIQSETITTSLDKKESEIESIHSKRKKAINDRAEKKREEISGDDSKKRESIEIAAKPTFKEGLKVATISAGFDAAFSGGTEVCRKVFSEKKKIGDFESEDWKDIGKETVKGGSRGFIMGSAVYLGTNLTKKSAPAVSAVVTGTVGVGTEVVRFFNDEIDGKQFSLNVAKKTTGSAASFGGAIAGQALIPIPIVGAMVGSIVANGVVNVVFQVVGLK